MPRSQQFLESLTPFRRRLGIYARQQGGFMQPAHHRPGPYRTRFIRVVGRLHHKRVSQLMKHTAASKIQRNWRVKRSRVNPQRKAKYTSHVRRFLRRQYRS